MARKLRKTNLRLISLRNALKAKAREKNAVVWRDIAERLERPTRNYSEVNLSKINRYAEKKETVVVPGKVLGSGVLEHSVTVAAFNFSAGAAAKIKEIGGRCLTIEELVEENPTGSKVRIVG
jgi:large subunit ribosomal protein L18e